VGVLAERRLTRRQLARAIGVSPEWLTRVFNGHENISRKLRRDLSRYLNEPEEKLFHDLYVVIERRQVPLGEFVAEQRQAQGLPRRVEDASSLGRIGVLLKGGGRDVS
jgi:transcriptional regulator with XRE-family HTH domain